MNLMHRGIKITMFLLDPAHLIRVLILDVENAFRTNLTPMTTRPGRQRICA